MRSRTIRRAAVAVSSALASGGVLVAAEPAGAVVSGCHTSTSIRSSNSAAGNTIGTGRTTGRWCVLGAVGNADRLGGYAETSTPGWVASGLLGSNAGVVSGEGRSWSQYKLTLGTTWLTLQEVTLCPRVRGNVNGVNTPDNVCSIW